MQLAFVLVSLALAGIFPTAASAAGDVTFERSAYDTVQAVDAGGVTTMTVTSRPAGLSYTATLDPTKTYRLRVVGRTSQAGVIMRIRTDDQLQYLRAPNGLYSARVEGAEELEVLLYRHYETDDEQYRIFELSAEECADRCPGDDDLRAEILRARPRLATALTNGDRLTAATEVMHWAAVRTPVAGGAPPLQTRGGILTAAELWYDQLSTGEIGVLCGGASDLLGKLLDLFGIPSFVMDFGDPAVYTHVVVVVNAGDATTPQWHMLDPTFDTVLRAAGSGVPLPLPEALEAWRAGRSDLIEVSSGGLVGRPIVSDPDGDGIVEKLRCDDDAASGWSGCGLAQLSHDFDAVFEAAGHGRGYDAILSLLARGTLFYTDFFGTPDAFTALHAALRQSLIANDDVHVADLPLAPRNVTAPSLTDAGAGRLTAAPGAWQLRPGSWESDQRQTVMTPAAVVQWLRCREQCTAVPGSVLPTHVLSLADLGAELVARVTVANRWGSTTAETLRTPPVEPQDVFSASTRLEERPATAPSQLLPARPSALSGTSPARAAPARASARIEGIRRAGERLRCVTRGVPGTAIVSWWRADRRIANRARRCRVRARDRGHRIRCRAVFSARAVRSPAVSIRSSRR